MLDDHQLLSRYASDGSETAFGELVARHVNLVYSTALRRTNGDTQLAQDVAQLVFTDLARKARSLPDGVVLAGWLHRATRYAVAQIIRTERRRQVREKEAAAMNSLTSETAPDWEQIRPLLDQALDQLNQADRDAVLLRFFEQRSLAEVGRALGANEDAARKRVSRALEKLRNILVQRGLATTSATLTAVISANAIQAAPAGLAASIAATSLSSAAGTGATLTILKLMSMTKLQLGVTALVLAGAATSLIIQHQNQATVRAENESLRRQIAQLQTDNLSLSNRIAQAKSVRTLSLPAPRMTGSASPADSVQDWNSTNLIARLNRGEKPPTLTAEQVESYLKESRRTAGSLLAIYRANGDPKFLEEAMEKYPNDPQVAFTAAYQKDISPEERRHWLDVFKQSAPDNALPGYLSALEHFKLGETDQAVQDLGAAAGRQKFQDYSSDFIQNSEEAFRAAGYPEAEARIIPAMSILLPQLRDLKQLNGNLINLATAYRQAGDEASAQMALQMDATLGQSLRGSEGTPLITQLVGMTIEGIALKQMDPTSPYSDAGQTVKDRLDELTQQRATLNQFVKQLDNIYTTISAPDWISYHDRWQAFGEENAMRWLLNKYGGK